MTNHKDFYYILTFDTNADAMCADKCSRESDDIRAALMPLPQEFKSGCGFALRFLDDNLEAILKFCNSAPFNGRLFKMHTKRINGHRPIDPISLTSFDFSE